jgi:hypothetical protein
MMLQDEELAENCNVEIHLKCWAAMPGTKIVCVVSNGRT